MITVTYRVSCDATARSACCLGITGAGDSPSEAPELARVGGWLRLAPDGPNDPVTHLCPVCAVGPRG